MTDRSPVYLTLRQAARLLGVHPNTLRRYLDEGKLSGVETIHTAGGHHRLHRRQLLLWREGRRETVQEKAPDHASGAWGK